MTSDYPTEYPIKVEFQQRIRRFRVQSDDLVGPAISKVLRIDPRQLFVHDGHDPIAIGISMDHQKAVRAARSLNRLPRFFVEIKTVELPPKEPSIQLPHHKAMFASLKNACRALNSILDEFNEIRSKFCLYSSEHYSEPSDFHNETNCPSRDSQAVSGGRAEYHLADGFRTVPDIEVENEHTKIFYNICDDSCEIDADSKSPERIVFEHIDDAFIQKLTDIMSESTLPKDLEIESDTKSTESSESFVFIQGGSSHTQTNTVNDRVGVHNEGCDTDTSRHKTDVA